MCNNHIASLRSKIQDRVHYIEWKGQQVPLSPDGIPMLQYVKAIGGSTYDDFAHETIAEIHSAKQTPKHAILNYGKTDAGSFIPGCRKARFSDADSLIDAVDFILKGADLRFVKA